MGPADGDATFRSITQAAHNPAMAGGGMLSNIAVAQADVDDELRRQRAAAAAAMGEADAGEVAFAGEVPLESQVLARDAGFRVLGFWCATPEQP